MLLQMKNPFRKGLFHPNDIKTVGLTSSSPGPKTAPLPTHTTSSPGPRTAPLPSLHHKHSRPSINPVSSPGLSSSPRGHSRSSSFAGQNAGSFGRSEARRMHSPPEFIKYTEDDEEDYDDIFGKPSGPCKCYGRISQVDTNYVISFTAVANSAIEYSVVR